MYIREYLKVLLRRPLLTVLVGLVVFAGVLGQAILAGPSYSASTSLLFAVSGGNSATDLNQAATYLQREMASYTRVATSPRVLQPVITQLGLPDTPTSLAANVKVTNPTTTVLLDISVTRPDAEQAAQIANAISAQLKTVVEEMAPTQTEGGVRRSTVQVTLLNEAVAPTIPAGMSLPVTGVLGVFAGFAAAFVVA